MHGAEIGAGREARPLEEGVAPEDRVAEIDRPVEARIGEPGITTESRAGEARRAREVEAGDVELLVEGLVDQLDTGEKLPKPEQGGIDLHLAAQNRHARRPGVPRSDARAKAPQGRHPAGRLDFARLW